MLPVLIVMIVHLDRVDIVLGMRIDGGDAEHPGRITGPGGWKADLGGTAGLRAIRPARAARAAAQRRVGGADAGEARRARGAATTGAGAPWGAVRPLPL